MSLSTVSEHLHGTSDALEALLSDAEVNVMGITQCPLCNSKGSEDSPKLVEHIMQHVHDLSLRSLPWANHPVSVSDMLVGTFDLSWTKKVVKDDESMESVFEIAGWVTAATPILNLEDGTMMVNDSEGNGLTMAITGWPTNTSPTLQLCSADRSRASYQQGESPVPADILSDYFIQHDYFKDASSESEFSSHSSYRSQQIQAISDAEEKSLVISNIDESREQLYTSSFQRPYRSPPYIFKIDELRENPATVPEQDDRGYWVPTTAPGWNYRSQEGITGTYWLCDGATIYAVPTNILPPLNHFKTFPLFYCGGLGFYVLQGDGTAPGRGESWHTIRFDPVANGSSYLTPAGANETLQCQRADQKWAHKLLPNIYHGPQTQDPHQGGLQGELPILLALAAMSMNTTSLQQWLPWMFQSSR